jgi:hypothetical protein
MCKASILRRSLPLILSKSFECSNLDREIFAEFTSISQTRTRLIANLDRSPELPCTHKPPIVSVQIKDKNFFIRPSDLLMRWPNGKSQSMIGETAGPDIILGMPFLKNVVAVHDKEHLKMQFVHRVY